MFGGVVFAIGLADLFAFDGLNAGTDKYVSDAGSRTDYLCATNGVPLKRGLGLCLTDAVRLVGCP